SFGVEDAELGGQLALDVGEHREGEIPQLFLFAAPGQVHELAVDAHAEDLRITSLELLVQLAEGGNLGRAYEGEVLRPEEHDAPLALVRVLVDGLEGALEVARDHARE